MGLFDAIQDFFMSLFVADPDERQKIKDLRIIRENVNAVKPVYYNYTNLQVLPAFATSILQLYRNLGPFAELFNKTINHINSKRAQQFKEYLVESNLAPQVVERRADFTYDMMKARIEGGLDMDTRVQQLKSDFDDYINYFNQSEVKQIDVELREILSLLELIKFNFDKLLSMFDPRINLVNPNFKPTFSPTPGLQIFEDLLDFYYLLANVKVDVMVEKNLSLLVDKLHVEHPDAIKKKFSESLRKLATLIQKKLQTDHLLGIIRLIKDDPYFEIAVQQDRSVSFVHNYKTAIQNRFSNDIENISRDITDAAIGGDLKAIFGDTPLHDLDAYNQGESNKLMEFGLKTFTKVKALSVLKTFLFEKFERDLKGQLSKIMLDGFFEDKKFQNSLSDIVYKCEKSFTKVCNFEESFRERGKSSIVTINKYLGDLQGGKDVGILINRIVDTANARVEEIIEEEANLYFQLASHMMDLINDYKKPQPELVSNIKTMGGDLNREIMAEFVNSYNSIAKFIRVMKHFTIIKKKKKGLFG